MNIKRFFNADASDASEGVVIGSTFNLGEAMGLSPATDGSEAGDDAGGAGATDAPDADASGSASPVGQDAGKSTTDAPAAGSVNDTNDTNPGGGDKPAQLGQGQGAETAAAGATDGQGQKPQPGLQEILQGRGRSEVLQALGVDPALVGILESAQSLAELKNILDIKTKDWDSVPHEEVLREQLRRDYADLDDAKFEKVFKAELKKYNLDSFDEEEKELGLIRLERDANKIRQSLKKEQADFRLPEPKPSAEAQQLMEARKKAQAEYEAFVQEIRNDEFTKRLMQDKRLVLADGYNYEVNPDGVVEAILNTSKLFEKCIREDGSYDLNRAYRIAAYSQDPDAFERALVEHGQSRANKELVDEYVNPSKREPAPSGPKDESLAEAFATRGVHTSLGSVLGF